MRPPVPAVHHEDLFDDKASAGMFHISHSRILCICPCGCGGMMHLPLYQEGDSKPAEVVGSMVSLQTAFGPSAKIAG